MAALRPLLLLTRPQATSEAFWAALPEKTRAAVDFLINPLLSIQFTGPLPDLTWGTGVRCPGDCCGHGNR
jgi:uroporphyrinogen-III synthase